MNRDGFPNGAAGDGQAIPNEYGMDVSDSEPELEPELGRNDHNDDMSGHSDDEHGSGNSNDSESSVGGQDTSDEDSEAEGSDIGYDDF